MTQFEPQKIYYYSNQAAPEYNPKTIAREHLNNFGLRLPGSVQRPALEREDQKTFEEILGADCGYSPLALQQTPREFFDSIDRAVKEAGTPDDVIEKLGGYVVISKRVMTPEEADLEKHVFRIYEILRKQGYYQIELTR
ncbi:MAG: hypothetical protein KDD62_08935 [Bdellovibrionales bacterium]|nr:hypothetical protein [Bdellovibrionales bacterium]